MPKRVFTLPKEFSFTALKVVVGSRRLPWGVPVWAPWDPLGTLFGINIECLGFLVLGLSNLGTWGFRNSGFEDLVFFLNSGFLDVAPPRFPGARSVRLDW